jgi:small GTP-binding protein
MEDDEDDNEYITCKVVMVGEPGVGKTSIISRYVLNQFSNVVISTTGASYATKIIELDKDNKIKFQIWDTAGQERFRSLAKIFYQNAAAVVLVYDITVRDTFEKLKEYWIKEIKDNAPSDIIIALAGNKSDNYEFEVVSLKEGQDLAKQIDAIYKSTSAMLSNGIEELFKSIALKFVNPTSSFFNSVPASKDDLKKSTIIEKKKHKNKKVEKKKCCQ